MATEGAIDIKVLARLTCKEEAGIIRYGLTIGLRNKGKENLELPAVAVEFRVDGTRFEERRSRELPWWRLEPGQWQPTQSEAAIRFYTWTGKDTDVACIYPRTDIVTISDLEVHSIRNGSPMPSAAFTVIIYGSNYSRIVAIAISADEAEQLNEESRYTTMESCKVWER